MSDATAAVKIPGVLLAGGLARRMGGGDKPMRTIAGRTILDRVDESTDAMRDRQRAVHRFHEFAAVVEDLADDRGAVAVDRLGQSSVAGDARVLGRHQDVRGIAGTLVDTGDLDDDEPDVARRPRLVVGHGAARCARRAHLGQLEQLRQRNAQRANASSNKASPALPPSPS